MIEFDSAPRRIHRIVSGQGTLEFSEKTDGVMRFCCGGVERFRITPAKINNFEERASVPRKCRVHRSADGLSSSIDVERRLPFGSEYLLSRIFEVHHNSVRLRLDVLPGTGTITRLEPGDLEFPGEWSKVSLGIYEGGAVRFLDLAAGGCVDSVRVGGGLLLSIRLLAESGLEMEFSIGGDLWRHDIASALPDCTCAWQAERGAEGVKVCRTTVAFEVPESAPGRRAYRLKSCLVWRVPGESKGAPEAEEGETVCRFSGCLMSNVNRRALRDFVRKNPGCRLAAKSDGFGICSDGSHVERKGQVLHRDIEEYLDFRLKANRELARSGGSFRFLPAKKEFLAEEIVSERFDFQELEILS
ncbi:MAG: hypothetical protein PHS41_10880 [Victivallaceae bacterium]|nr:hypothetical protein [Victivallaceae bacterium]